jgi:hypothetical protein
MIIAMSANLQRIVQFALVQGVLTFGTFNEYAGRVDRLLLVIVGSLDLRFIAFEPGHLIKDKGLMGKDKAALGEHVQHLAVNLSVTGTDRRLIYAERQAVVIRNYTAGFFDKELSGGHVPWV